MIFLILTRKMKACHYQSKVVLSGVLSWAPLHSIPRDCSCSCLLLLLLL